MSKVSLAKIDSLKRSSSSKVVGVTTLALAEFLKWTKDWDCKKEMHNIWSISDNRMRGPLPLFPASIPLVGSTRLSDSLF